MLYFVPRKVEKILEKHEEILVTLKNIQTIIQNLEQQLSSSNRSTRERLPLSFETKPLLHKKWTAKVISKYLTDE